ncbi:MAG: hypothetical protein L0226_06830, partial [Acidobacteria bacterium]|nr:hypothetical protein [Acidobacteriota bacterium]
VSDRKARWNTKKAKRAKILASFIFQITVCGSPQRHREAQRLHREIATSATLSAALFSQILSFSPRLLSALCASAVSHKLLTTFSVL